MRDGLNNQRIPFEPLRPYLHRLGIERDTSAHRHLERCKAQGYLSVAQADEWCCELLGIHPAALWPEVFA